MNLSAAAFDGCEASQPDVTVRRFGSGRPLLFLHGMNSLQAVPECLTVLAERYEVILPDHPGFGTSIGDGFSSVRELALFYLDLMEKLDLRDIHLVGHSLGGWIAAELAICSVERLGALTLVSAAGLRIKGVPRADVFMKSGAELSELLFDRDPAGQAAAWSLDADAVKVHERDRVASARLTWQPRLADLKLHRWLHRVNVPTQIIWGENDQVIPVSYAHEYAKLIPGAEIAILPRCGHDPVADDPQGFAALVSKFGGMQS